MYFKFGADNQTTRVGSQVGRPGAWLLLARSPVASGTLWVLGGHGASLFAPKQKYTHVLGRIATLTADLEQRAAALDQRLAKLEQEEETRYRQYDAEKPKQPRPDSLVNVNS